MSPEQRRREVADVIGRNEVATQAEILALLSADGIVMTQATLSRDLREVGAFKRDGRYRLNREDRATRTRRRRMLADLSRRVLNAQVTGPLLVVTTGPGMAQPLALELASGAFHEVLGTIAGVDTVFVAVESPGRARSLAGGLRGRLPVGQRPPA